MSDRTTPLYHVVRFTSWCVLRLANRFEAIGREHVPSSGPVILACNHLSYVDPPALGCGLARPVAYMAKQQLFSIPVLGPAIRELGAFPVDRSRGDVAAIKAATSILEEGRILGIFPEGTRNLTGTIAPQLGVALLASWTGAPVVPAHISGSQNTAKFAKVTVSYGEPFAFDLGRKARRTDLAKWTTDLMTRIHALAPTQKAPQP